MTPVQKLMLIDHISKDSTLSNRDVRVAIQIVQHYNANRGKAWTSIRYLADLLAMSKNTVQKAVNALETTGWIIRKSGHLGQPNVYQFQPSRVPKPATRRTNSSSNLSQQGGTNKDYDNSPYRVRKNNPYEQEADKVCAQAEPDPTPFTAKGDFYG